MRVRQLSLNEILGFDLVFELKRAMKKAIKEAEISREEVVDRMHKLARLENVNYGLKSQRITVALLDKWVAESATGHVIPTKLLPIFCRATNSIEPVSVLAKYLGFRVIGSEEVQILEWAKLELKRRKISKQCQKLARELGI